MASHYSFTGLLNIGGVLTGIYFKPLSEKEAQALGHVTAQAPQIKSIAGRNGSGITRKKWSKEDDNTLIMLWQRGTRPSEIANVLKRTPASISSRADELRHSIGVTLRPFANRGKVTHASK